MPITTHPAMPGIPSRKLQEFICAQTVGTPTIETPYVVVDLDIVAERYDSLRAALPIADVFYAVKANPAREILELVVERGGHFDVASPAEIEMCLAAGAAPADISFGNTIKKQRDISTAYAQGVRLFAFDAEYQQAHPAIRIVHGSNNNPPLNDSASQPPDFKASWTTVSRATTAGS